MRSQIKHGNGTCSQVKQLLHSLPGEAQLLHVLPVKHSYCTPTHPPTPVKQLLHTLPGKAQLLHPPHLPQVKQLLHTFPDKAVTAPPPPPPAGKAHCTHSPPGKA